MKKAKASPKNKQKKKRQRNRGANSNNQVGVKISQQLKPFLSECAMDYLAALADPVDYMGPAACIPDVLTLPSFKFSAVSRGTFSTGSGGIGWAVLDPWKMASNNGGFLGDTSNYPVLYTLPTYTQTSYTWSVSGAVPTTGVAGANSTSLFNYASLTSGNGITRQVRLVAGGIRIRYTGTELNKGGSVILYRMQGNSSVRIPSTVPDLLTSTQTLQLPVTRQSELVTYSPDNPNFFGYHPFTDYHNAAGTSPTANDRYSLLCLVVAPTGVNLTFDFEAVSHFELIGDALTLSPSHADPVGLGAVVSATPPKIIPDPRANAMHMLKSATNSILRNSSGVVASAANIGGKLLAGSVTGHMARLLAIKAGGPQALRLLN